MNTTTATPENALIQVTPAALMYYEEIAQAYKAGKTLEFDMVLHSLGQSNTLRELLEKNLIVRVSNYCGFSSFTINDELTGPETLNEKIIRTGKYELFEIYKNKMIYNMTNKYQPVYMVFDPVKDTLFQIGLDDSKRSGKRVFYESTITEARQYIDYITK